MCVIILPSSRKGGEGFGLATHCCGGGGRLCAFGYFISPPVIELLCVWGDSVICLVGGGGV